jgi:formate-dependent nitrite reductase membrane component NrfD
MLLAEHFTQPPQWEWYILGYFFLAGLAGGSYVLGTMLRLFGRPNDEPAARIAFIAALVCLAICPILLTLDLGQPLRFWHMLVDSAQGTLAFKYWSPMSVGAYALTVCGLFFFFSAVDALLAWRGSDILKVFRGGPFGAVWMVLGSILGLFLAAYTGVLLSVSNQPVWSDSWALGALFLASGLSGSAALLLLLARRWRAADSSSRVLAAADAYFLWLEAILIVVFLVTVGIAGFVAQLFAPLWILLWVLVLIGLAVPLLLQYRVVAERSLPPVVAPLLVLIGVLALRAVVIFGAQS